MKFETIFFQMLNMKFCSKQVYDGKYIKATVRILIQFFGMVKSQKKSVRYICIAVISIDSVIKMKKKSYP